MRPSIAALAACGLAACTADSPTTDSGAGQFRAEAWADNWFAVYQGDQLLGEDSVPVTTERSFNAETFSFAGAYPLALSFVLKDYKQDNTGLEYIGTTGQQMGDGGFSFQLTDEASGEVVLVSSAAWRCRAIHQAPINVDCERDADPSATCRATITAEPAGWKDAGHDDTAWPGATEHTADAVGPKDGYLTIDWDRRARLIWTSDLEVDNTLLCRVTVAAP